MPLPPCPYCGSQPEVERVTNWPRGHGPAPWYAGCYRGGDAEHFVGGNGDMRAEAEAVWCEEVRKLKGSGHGH